MDPLGLPLGACEIDQEVSTFLGYNGDITHCFRFSSIPPRGEGPQTALREVYPL